MAPSKLNIKARKVSVIAAAVLFLGMFVAGRVDARTFRIFEVRKNLPLTDDEPVVHDYYLNAGSSQGLKSGMLVPVQRKEAVHDFYGDSEDDLILTVGHLKLIRVQQNISVGRMIVPRETRRAAAAPVLDFATIMIGDRVDLEGAVAGLEGGGDSGQQTGANSGPAAGASAAESADVGKVVAASPAVPNVAPAGAPKITVEPMGPAVTPQTFRDVANTERALPQLELHSPREFKNSAEAEGSLLPDERAPDVDLR